MEKESDEYVGGVVNLTSKDAFRKAIKDPSAWLLVILNISVLFMFIFRNLNLMEVLWIYFGQSLVIGFFWTIKILLFKKSLRKDYKIINYILVFFVMHLIFLFFLFGFPVITQSVMPLNLLYIASGIGMFIVNHTISFILNYKKDKEKIENMPEEDVVTLKYEFHKRKVKQNKLPSPYTRILPMHITFLFAFFMIPFFNSTSLLFKVAGIIFVLLKTWIDVIMHTKEH